jgi:hypothetical protein
MRPWNFDMLRHNTFIVQGNVMYANKRMRTVRVSNAVQVT